MKKNNELENKFDELFRRIELTSKNRYNGAERMRVHERLTSYTLGIVSVLQIGVSVAATPGSPLKIDAWVVSVIQICLSVFLLAYSLFTGAEKFGERSVRFHTCGLELGKLTRKLKRFKGLDGHEKEYDALSRHYYRVLDGSENHAPLDFMRTKLDLRERYFPGTGPHVGARITYAWLLALQYWHYFLVLILSGVLLAFGLGWNVLAFLTAAREATQ